MAGCMAARGGVHGGVHGGVYGGVHDRTWRCTAGCNGFGHASMHHTSGFGWPMGSSFALLQGTQAPQSSCFWQPAHFPHPLKPAILGPSCTSLPSPTVGSPEVKGCACTPVTRSCVPPDVLDVLGPVRTNGPGPRGTVVPSCVIVSKASLTREHRAGVAAARGGGTCGGALHLMAVHARVAQRWRCAVEARGGE